jgi:hypothetical protein
MKMAVLRLVAPCSLVDVYQLFKGDCCLNHQGALTHRPDDGASKHLRNIGTLLLDYTVQEPRRNYSSLTNKQTQRDNFEYKPRFNCI